MKNNPITKTLIIFILLFLISVFTFFYFYKKVNKNYQEYISLENKWQIEALRRNEIKTLERSVKMIDEEKRQLETHFAKSSDIVPFLDTIENLAPKSGVQAEVTSVEILENYNGLSVGMKASGSFSNLYKFLTLLENSPYELEFISVDLHKDMADNVKTAGLWNMVLQIKLLSFVQ